MGNKHDICHDEKTTYVGEIKNEKFHGDGTLYYNETGNLYKGKFKNGLKHGFAEMLYYNGDKYIGEFYLGELHGKGKYFNNNGYICESVFSVGTLLGHGTMYDINGDLIYEGEFLNSFPHGLGISYSNGKVLYVGKWNQNLYHGYGLLIENNTNKYGLFQEGVLVEQINKIPASFNKYIKNVYSHDSHINLTKQVDSNQKSTLKIYPNLKAQSFTPVNSIDWVKPIKPVKQIKSGNSVNPTNPINPINPINRNNSRQVLQPTEARMVENPFNRILLNPIISLPGRTMTNSPDETSKTQIDKNSSKFVFDPVNIR